MRDHRDFTVGQPVHSLDYWSSPDLSRISPQTAPSRLRQLADAQAAWSGAWSSAIASGPVLLLAGCLISFLSGNPAWVAVLGAAGVALTFLGLSGWKKVRGRLPDTRAGLITRGPGSARGGVVMVAVLALVTGAILAAASPGIAARGGATLASVVGAYLLLVALLVACILVPAVVLGRGRESFRRRIRTDARLRAAVEADLANWQDPHGTAGFGPL